MRNKTITEQVLDCSFCGAAEGDVDFLVEGDGVFICDVCVGKANDIVKENHRKNLFGQLLIFTPPKK